MPQWRKHPDFPNYEISDEARVVNLHRERDPRPSLNRHGGLRIVLFNKGVGDFFQLSRLVAELYLEDWDPRFVVGFKDGNNLNCAADNLYMTDKAVA